MTTPSKMCTFLALYGNQKCLFVIPSTSTHSYILSPKEFVHILILYTTKKVMLILSSLLHTSPTIYGHHPRSNEYILNLIEVPLLLSPYEPLKPKSLNPMVDQPFKRLLLWFHKRAMFSLITLVWALKVKKYPTWLYNHFMSNFVQSPLGFFWCMNLSQVGVIGGRLGDKGYHFFSKLPYILGWIAFPYLLRLDVLWINESFLKILMQQNLCFSKF